MINLIDIMRTILIFISMIFIIYAGYLYYRLDKEIYKNERNWKKNKKREKKNYLIQIVQKKIELIQYFAVNININNHILNWIWLFFFYNLVYKY